MMDVDVFVEFVNSFVNSFAVEASSSASVVEDDAFERMLFVVFKEMCGVLMLIEK